MKCPRCGAEMQIGSPHDDGWVGQWECPYCDYIQGISHYGDD